MTFQVEGVLERVPEWRGSFHDWRTALGLTHVQAANFLQCGKSKVQGLEHEDPRYKLHRAERIAMQAVIDAARRQVARKQRNPFDQAGTAP